MEIQEDHSKLNIKHRSSSRKRQRLNNRSLDSVENSNSASEDTYRNKKRKKEKSSSRKENSKSKSSKDERKRNRSQKRQDSEDDLEYLTHKDKGRDKSLSKTKARSDRYDSDDQQDHNRHRDKYRDKSSQKHREKDRDEKQKDKKRDKSARDKSRVSGSISRSDDNSELDTRQKDRKEKRRHDEKRKADKKQNGNLDQKEDADVMDDDELENQARQRRKRVMELQAKRRKEEKQKQKELEQQENEAKGWTLDDDMDEDEATKNLSNKDVKKMARGQDLEDVKNKFQETQLVKEEQTQQVDKDNEDIDPLDAFMQNLGQEDIVEDQSNLEQGQSKPDLKLQYDKQQMPKVVKFEDEMDLDDRIKKEDVKDIKLDNSDLAIKQNGINMTVKQEKKIKGKPFFNFNIQPKTQPQFNFAVPKKQENDNANTQKKKKRGVAQQYESSSSEYSDLGSDADSQDKGEKELTDKEWRKAVMQGHSKADKLAKVDHSTIKYPDFKRNFYIEVPALQRMNQEEVDSLRKELDNIKVRGKEVPKPVQSWAQCGFQQKILDLLKKFGFSKPMPIQAQALPIIMSGRDCIGVAKTGSGKTLAYVLPMIRHVMDQPPLKSGDGPIAIVMAPTRELVVQIGREVDKFSRNLGFQCTCVYGGSQMSTQISALKRGSEVVVCSPGRMIEVLTLSNGKICNLRRVTFLILDEADRMFDMGFEPQIQRVTQNIRPNRQTAMFSATFPKQVEVLAKNVLDNPCEILIGGRSVANPDITQYVEIRNSDNDRFHRLLEILGEYYDQGKILVFVNTQNQCDNLFSSLLKHGYPCLSLHGGQDQTDRASTISGFKSDVCKLLVATSVAARGLDVPNLILVINYDVPDHHEDYVHRVGRTGRAGNKGTAITFISESQDEFAPDLVKALQDSKQVIPQDLWDLSQEFLAKKKKGLAQGHGSGYGGSGFKFDKREEEQRIEGKREQRKQFGVEFGHEQQEQEDSDTESEGIRLVVPQSQQQILNKEQQNLFDISNVDTNIQGNENVQKAYGLLQSYIQSSNQTGQGLSAQQQSVVQQLSQTLEKEQQIANQQQQQGLGGINPLIKQAQEAASQVAQKYNLGGNSQALPKPVVPTPQEQSKQIQQQNFQQMQHYEAEIEINDFPQHARWKITHRDTIQQIAEETEAAVTVRGQYLAGNRKPVFETNIELDDEESQRKLYLLIEGATEQSVRNAKYMIRQILEETTEKAMRRDVPTMGRYNVLK